MKWSGKIVEIYDLWRSQNSIEELPFWKEICPQHLKNFTNNNKPCVVELCSGTGRFLSPVIKSLVKYYPDIKEIGLDYYPEINRLLMKKAYSMNLRDNITVVDLSDKNCDSALAENNADIILFPFNHFELVGDKNLQDNIVKNVSLYLKPGSIFITANYNSTNRFKNSTGAKEFRWVITDPQNKSRVLFYWRQQTQMDIDSKYAQITYGVECVEWFNDEIKIYSQLII